MGDAGTDFRAIRTKRLEACLSVMPAGFLVGFGFLLRFKSSRPDMGRGHSSGMTNVALLRIILEDDGRVAPISESLPSDAIREKLKAAIRSLLRGPGNLDVGDPHGSRAFPEMELNHVGSGEILRPELALVALPVGGERHDLVQPDPMKVCLNDLSVKLRSGAACRPWRGNALCRSHLP